TGNVLEVLRRTCRRGSVMGFDLPPVGLAMARRRSPGALLVQATIDAPPFGAVFDIVGAFDVLEHLPDDPGALGPITGMLRPGGRLVVTVPAHTSLWSHVDVAACHQRRY